MRPSVQGNQAITVNRIEVSDFLRRDNRFRIIDNKHHSAAAAHIERKIAFKIRKGFDGITGIKIFDGDFGIPAVHRRNIGLLHLLHTKRHAA